MVGNAAEEGLLGQLGNPSHSDPARVVALAAFVAGGIGYLAVRWFIPQLTVWGGVMIGIVVCIAVSWILARYFRQRQSMRQTMAMEQRRATEIADTELRIAGMRQTSYIKERQA